MNSRFLLLLSSSMLLAACSEAVTVGSGAVDAGLSPDTTADFDSGGSAVDGTAADGERTDSDTVRPAPVGTLVLNEVAPAGEPEDWFEVYNASDTPIDLTGWSFSDSIDENKGGMFPAETIAPGNYLQVFVTEEDDGFKLGGDEEFAIFAPDGMLVDSVDWEDGVAPAATSWARLPDATGPFGASEQTAGAPNLALGESAAECGDGFIDDDEACDDGNTRDGEGCSMDCQVETGWDCSGEPSRCDEVDGPIDPPPAPDVVVNEIVAKAADNGPDWIEFYNREDEAVDMTGYFVGDSGADNMFELPVGTSIAAGGFLVLEQGADFDFGLGAADGVMLLMPDARIVDSTVWREGEAPEGASWGRFDNGFGAFKTLLVPTRGAENVDEEPVIDPCGNGVLEADETCDAGGTMADSCSAECQLQAPWGVVINEVLAKVADGPDAIELMNTNAFPVDISGWNYTDDTGFPDGDDERPATLAVGTVLPAGGRLLLQRDVDFLFGLADSGDVVTLTTSDTDVVVDTTTWEDGDADEGTSWARQPDGTGAFQADETPTPGAEN
jgi:cysteine-rich repeat protein